MSFSDIPDINPYINITIEDAINLLLTSVAMEETSLSKLLDAEAKKIVCVLNECKNKDSALEDAISINKSVDETVKNMIKMQMLLQFKLDNIKEFLPLTTTSTTTSSSTTATTCSMTTTSKTHTYTTTHTTTCTTCTCSTTTTDEYECGLKGKGVGTITNECDEFYDDSAVLQAFVFSCDYINRSLRYTIEGECGSLYMAAVGRSIGIECPTLMCPNCITISGRGNFEKRVKRFPNIVRPVKFILKVFEKPMKRIEYRIKIASISDSELLHDSGIVEIKNMNSGMKMVL